jgi:hypothetical protein
MGGYPEPNFAHLLRLSDDVGILEHARGSVPLREDGYCVDDAARAVVVICREPSPSPALAGLLCTLLAFLVHAAQPNGTLHNRLGYDRRWRDSPGTGDWWGRALMAFGCAVASAPEAWMRDTALTAFDRSVGQRSSWPRAMAFAGIGAADLLAVIPNHAGARQMLVDATTTVGEGDASIDWPWPQPRLTYANAVLAEVHLAAGTVLGDPRATAVGERLLSWFMRQEEHEGHLSVTPVGGWAGGEPRPGFDQQPIEAAAIADACARAAATSVNSQWTDGLRMAAGWFLGDNDASSSMLCEETGGSADGLGPAGSSRNRGAASALALLSTLQHARGLPGWPRGH